MFENTHNDHYPTKNSTAHAKGRGGVAIEKELKNKSK